MSSIKEKLIKTKSLQALTKFPHNYRYFTAKKMQAINFSLRFLVFIGIFGFFLINVGGDLLVAPHADRPGGLSLQNTILINPNNPENYRLFADEFLKNHDLQGATYFNDLGLSLEPMSLSLLKQKDEIYYLKNEPRFLAEEIPIWKNVINRYPDYRDGYARLMWLNLKLGKTEEAKQYFEVVRTIDPNWLPLEQITF